MAQKKSDIESKALLDQERAFQNIEKDDRSNRVCPQCAIMTCLKKCPKCGSDTMEI